jgi:TolB-like protein
LSIYAELKRRNVIRVAIAYGVASWVLLQIVDVIAPILELPAWAPKLVFVILAIGMVAVLVFAWAFELTPEGLKKDSEVDRTQSIASTTGRKLNFVIVAFLAVAVVLLLLERQLADSQGETPEAAAADVAAPLDQDSSIAVLPFVNMSSDPEQEFFSDGITEEILNSLASVKDLKVAGRTSSFAFKGQNDDLRRIGDALGVSHILEGSVRKAGEQVRITAQLIQVDNGFHLWSETYDRELTDVFKIQDEIANEILKQLKSQLLATGTRVADVQETTPEVYALYLKAKQRIYTRVPSEIETAVSELDRAIDIDPAYAPVYAQRGIATMILSEQQYGTIPHDEATRRGKRFVDKALELDADLAEGLAALGLYYSNVPGEYDRAIDPLVKALEINPNLIDASNWLQSALNAMGDYTGALAILEDIAERDPLYRPAFSNAINLFNSFNMSEKADALIRRIEIIDPDNPDLLLARAISYMYSGRLGFGLEQIEERNKTGEMSGVARVYLSVGLLGTLQFERAIDEGSPYLKPEALFSSGRQDEAIAAAEKIAADGYPDALFTMLNRSGRSNDLVSYLEERWPSISDFAEEYRGDQDGYNIMAQVAYAYSQLGKQQRFDEAMDFVGRHYERLLDQGVDNVVFDYHRGVQYALLGDAEQSLDYLQASADGGMSTNGALTRQDPAFKVLDGHPRFAEIEATMLATTNRDRAVVGLPPVDENYQAMATPMSGNPLP